MTAVKAVPDKFGWDFHVTIPPAHPDRGSHELRDVERQCKVQIKTTTPDERRVPITLSNWERMAKEQVAWFVVVVRLGIGSATPHDAFLVHIGEKQIAKVLKRLRQHDAARPNKRLNEIEMSLDFDAKSRLKEPLPESLRRAMLDHLGSNETAYAKSKDSWRCTVGFEERPVRISFQVSATDSDAMYSRWADWSIGKEAKLPVKNVEMRTVRFGISQLVRRSADDEQVDFTIPKIPSLGKTRLRLFNAKKTEMASLDCDTRASAAIAPWLPAQHHKVLLVAPFFSLLLQRVGEGVRLTWSFVVPGDQRHSLSELERVAKFVRVVSGAKDKGLFLVLERRGFPVTPQDVSSLSSNAEFHERLVPLAHAIMHAARVAACFGLDVSSIEVLPEEIETYWVHLAIYAASIDPGASPLDIELETDVDVSGKPSAIVIGLSIPLGDDVVLGVAVVRGVGERRHPPDSESSMVGLRERTVSMRFRDLVSYSNWDRQIVMEKMNEIGLALRAEGIEPMFPIYLLLWPPGQPALERLP
jgi:hypothetical protein